MKTQLTITATLILLSSFSFTGDTHAQTDNTTDASRTIAPKMVSGDIMVIPLLKSSTGNVETMIVGEGVLKLGSSCINVDGSYDADNEMNKAKTSPTKCPYEITTGIYERTDKELRSCYTIKSESYTVSLRDNIAAKKTHFYEVTVDCPTEKS